MSSSLLNSLTQLLGFFLNLLLRTTVFRDFAQCGMLAIPGLWRVQLRPMESLFICWCGLTEKKCLKTEQEWYHKAQISSQALDETTDPFQWYYQPSRSSWTLLSPWECRRDREVTSSEPDIVANRPAAYTSPANVTGGHREAVPREILSFHRLQPQTTGAVILMHLCTSSALRIPHLHRPWGGTSG